MNPRERDALPLIAYRLRAVAVGHLALTYTLSWDVVPAIRVFFDDKEVMDGAASGFTSPVIEAALIHCRALLEFLGLRSAGVAGLASRAGSKSDDVVIEDFCVDGRHLEKVTPEQALAGYTGGKAESEEALWYVLHTTNKALAHTTSEFRKSDRASVLLEIAFRGVLKLMEHYFYRPLAIEVPAYAVTGRKRVA
jgi:hypothetical protein